MCRSWTPWASFAVLALLGCPSPPPPSAPATPATPDAGAGSISDAAPLAVAPAPLAHRASPGRAPEPGAPGWVREHPAVTAGLLTSLTPWDDGVAVGTADGEIFSVSDANQWKQLGPRRNVGIVALASVSGMLFVLDADGALYRGDGGPSFVQIKQPPPGAPGDVRVPGVGRPWRALQVLEVSGQQVIALAGRSRHVAVSRDGGKTWMDDALGGPETFHAAHIDADGTVVITGERGRTFRRGPKAPAWDELHMEDKPTAMWIGRTIGARSALVSTDAGGAVRVFDGKEWARAGSGPGALRSLVSDGRQLLAACQAGGVVAVDPKKGDDAAHERIWEADMRPLYLVAVSGGNVWAAGPELLVRRRGKVWEMVRGARTRPLRGVAVIGAQRGFAAGDAGLLLGRSEAPAGTVWEPVLSPRPSGDLVSVSFASGRYGWLAGADGRVGRTDDGGKTWAFVAPGTVPGSLRAVAALDPLNVFAAGEGALWASSDRGETWRSLELPAGAGKGAITDLALERADRDARLLAARDGAALLETALGRSDVAATGLGFVTPVRLASAEGTSYLLDLTGLILRRSPGETAWRLMAVPAGLSFSGLSIAPDGAGLVVASSGAMFRTEDAGASWWLVTGGPQRAPSAVATGSGGNFVVVGHGGEIQQSSDRGVTWHKAQTGAGKSLTAVARIGSKLVAVGFRGAALESADGGKSWSPWLQGPTDVGTTHLTALEVDGDRVALGGIGALWVRESGAWTRLGVDGVALGEVRRLRWGKAAALAAVTATGGLWRRDASKLVPVEVAPPPKSNSDSVRWSDIATADARTLAVTADGVVEVSLTGEPSWARAGLTQTLGALPTGLQVVGERTWLLGSGGLWARDGGAWKQVVPALPTRPTDLDFKSADVGYLVGGLGTVYGTVDGGVTWRAEGTPTKTTLNAVHVAADGRAIAVGDGGTILSRVGR